MNVLIVGLGSIARRHIAALRHIDPEAGIVALRHDTAGIPLPGVRDIYSLDEMESRPDFAIISNPTALHAETIRALLPLRVPLFIEKPLFAGLGHEDLLEEIRRLGILTYVACNMRFLDTLRWLRGQVEALRINEVNVYCGSYLPDWRPGTDWRRCYSARTELGGGVHIDLIHEFDYIHWIFGDPQQVRKTLRHRSSLGIGAVDYANYCLEYEDFCISVVLNYYRRDYKRTVEVVAEEGTWTADLASGRVTDADGRTLFESSQDDDEVYWAQMNYFLSLLRKEAPASSNDVFEAYEVLKLCLG
ncbi:MAG: Gfo/Idh/MocA family oxidoreductase [Bacteroidales bacterium]|nr:Gfo/Idh/MocA family oxidoreductase [Bacteroidales bacterium]